MADQTLSLPASKRRLFAALAILLGCVAGLIVFESVLAWRAREIARSDQVDSALFARDPVLGWRLAPGVTGSHQHHDFSVTYSISPSGLRNSSRPSSNRPSNALFLGDSFTFGLGVNDADTFVSLLNANPGKWEFLNGGVPGYATDQQLLLLRRLLPSVSPEHVFLVIYLANDIFDNVRPNPLNFHHHKPTFSLSPSGELDYTPASQNASRRAREILPQLVLGPAFKSRRASPLFPRTLEALGFTTDPLGAAPFDSSDFLKRNQDAVNMTQALILEMRRALQKENVAFSIILLGGRSFAELPDSASARFQDALRTALLQWAKAESIPCLDAASYFRENFSKTATSAFFPYDGHLTPQGHRLFADFLQSSISSEKTLDRAPVENGH